MGMTYDCTDEELIAFIKKIVKAQKINKMLDEDTESTWKELGEKLLKCRMGLNISRQQVALKMNCSFIIPRHIEEGSLVRERDKMEAAYIQALKDIHHDRGKYLKILDEIEHEKNAEDEKNDL